MAGPSYLLLVVASLSTLCSTAPAPNSATGGGVVTGSVQHLIGRGGTAMIPTMKLGIGNPPQKVTVLLDTGSSDLVVPQTGSAICKDPQQQCTANGNSLVTGSFDAKSSTGVVKLDSLVKATYVNGVKLQGNFIKAGLSFQNQSVDQLQVALVTQGQLPPNEPLFPIFGVGPIQGEAGETYQNIPAGMKDAGATKANAYGLYLNDFRGSDGSIAFGGVDTAKFEGSLKAAPLVLDNNGRLPSFVVDFSSMTANTGTGAANTGAGPGNNRTGSGNNGAASGNSRNGAGNNRNGSGNNRNGSGNNRNGSGNGRNGSGNGRNGSGNGRNGSGNNGAGSAGRGRQRRQNNGNSVNLAPRNGFDVVLIDSGAPSLDLPPGTVQSLAKALGTSFNQDGSLGNVPCSMGQQGMTLSFGFNKDAAKIEVPLDMMLLPATNSGGGGARAGGGGAQCSLPIFATDDLVTLGAPFMQAAYIVFDMDNKQLLMAQAKMNATESNVQEFTAFMAGANK